MAEMTIQLQIDPQSGKKNIVVSLSSDTDALPHEHEEMHRKLVDKLIQGGLLKASELGKIIVAREEEKGAPEAAPHETPTTERRAQAEGGQ